MTTNAVTLELPETLYHQLDTVAQKHDLSPIGLIQLWLEANEPQPSFQQRWADPQKPATSKDRLDADEGVKDLATQRFQDTLAELRALIQAQGGLDVGESTEEIVEALRKTRQEIFEAE